MIVSALFPRRAAEDHGIAGIGCQSLHGVLPGPRKVASPLLAERQGYAGVGVAGSELEAAVQQLSALIELAEVHIAEAQVVEEVGPWDLLLALYDYIRNCQIV